MFEDDAILVLGAWHQLHVGKILDNKVFFSFFLFLFKSSQPNVDLGALSMLDLLNWPAKKHTPFCAEWVLSLGLLCSFSMQHMWADPIVMFALVSSTFEIVDRCNQTMLHAWLSVISNKLLLKMSKKRPFSEIQDSVNYKYLFG